MPNMANVVVKKNDGTTDITYTALSPSAGDKAEAMWRENSKSSIVNYRPTFTMSTQSNAAGTVRRVRTKYKYPVTATENGVEVLKGYHVIEKIAQLFQYDDASVNEAVSQEANLGTSTLIKQSAQAGFAPQ